MAEKMDPTIKARWVAALRSGEYKQTRGVLRRMESHCCLGVLCDLYAKEAGIHWSAQTLGATADGNLLADHLGGNGVPGAQVVMWSGLDTGKEVRINGRCDELACHNDMGRTFAEIADAIEAQL